MHAENRLIRMDRNARAIVRMAVFLLAAGSVRGEVLWERPGTMLAHNSRTSLLHGALAPRDRLANETLYFKFDVEPISDTATESLGPYFSGIVFHEGKREQLGIGNAWNSWAYSAFNASHMGPGNDAPGEFHLSSAKPEGSKKFEYARRGTRRTIVVKVRYFPGELADVTVWMDPDLALGTTEAKQQEEIRTRFRAAATFDDIRVEHGGGGGGWKYSDFVIATAFEDLVQPLFWQRWWFRAAVVAGLLVLVASGVRLVERRRSRARIEWLERKQLIASERERISRDIHDELGAELAQIGLLADLGSDAAADAKEAGRGFSSIARRARSVTAMLDEIVWAVNPNNDNLAHLADYLCRMADECFEEAPIRCRKEVPTGLPAVPLSAELRHDLALAVKEAFANLLKHSDASEAWLRLDWQEPELVIRVEDNGRGFDPATAPDGNGLKNQKARLERNGGRVELESTPGTGTRLTLSLRLPDSPTQLRHGGIPAFLRKS